MSSITSDFRPEVRRALPTIVGVRFAINIAMRMVYTFLPAFARGAGISVESMSTVLSARELTSLSAPLAGRASDRIGPLRLMAYGGVVAGVGLLISAFGAIGLTAGLIVFGFGRTAHQVSLNSWIGGAVSYERRGRVSGLIELTWGGAALIGLPLVGFLLGVLPWWAPLAMLGATALALSVRSSLLEATYKSDRGGVASRKPIMSRTSIAAIATNAAIAGSAQFLFLTHGLWLEESYGLDTAEVGLAVLAVGLVEVIATLGSSRLTDRLGKRRSMLGGSALMTAAMIVLALYSSPPLILGLALLAAAFLGFEFAIVSAIPLISELDPEARAQMVGRSMGITTITRAGVTLIATALYVRYGFATSMAVASVSGVVALLLAFFVMSEPGNTPERA